MQLWTCERSFCHDSPARQTQFHRLGALDAVRSMLRYLGNLQCPTCRTLFRTLLRPAYVHEFYFIYFFLFFFKFKTCSIRLGIVSYISRLPSDSELHCIASPCLCEDCCEICVCITEVYIYGRGESPPFHFQPFSFSSSPTLLPLSRYTYGTPPSVRLRPRISLEIGGKRYLTDISIAPGPVVVTCLPARF